MGTSIEELIRGVMGATPSVRRKVAEALRGITPPKQQREKQTRLLTISATAKMLALGRGTIYKLIRQKRLDIVMLTGVPRVTLQSIHDFIDGKNPENEITAEMIEASKARYAATKVKEV